MSKIVGIIFIFACFLTVTFPMLLVKLDDAEQQQEDEEQAEYLKKWKMRKK